MLRRLAVRDFAVIERLELELRPGMNVFSGETGAGKSILVDAIGLVLGNRARRGLIRAGAPRAEITLDCDPDDPPGLGAWLAERGFGDDACLLRRVLARDGAARAYVNDTPTSLRTLRAAGERLIEIHGQHEHQRLVRRAEQRALLDAACGHGRQLAALAALHRRWQETVRRLAELTERGAERAAERELLAFQAQELNALDPGADEYAELDARQRRLAGASELQELCGELVDRLYERDREALAAQLDEAAARVREAARIDPELDAAGELLRQARVCAEEAAGLLRGALDRVDLDPGSLAEVEQRLGTFFELARKHRVKPEELAAHARALNERLATFDDPQQDPAALAAEAAELERRYRAAAAGIHQTRAATAQRIAARTTRTLRQLGMPHSEFTIAVTHDAAREPAPHGLDDIEYRLAGGPGQAPGPVAEIASGGELSRLSLTLHQSLRDAARPPVMIFDEVDTGIGGGPAETVGKMLAELAADAQVLCVTHLPQVAAQAGHHYCVRKHGGARTEAAELDAAGRVEELARMFSGVEKMSTARAHAEALLARAARPGKMAA